MQSIISAPLTHEITRTHFGYYMPDEIKKLSVKKITNPVAFDGDGKHLTGISRRGGKPPIPCDGLFLVTARVPQTAFLGDALARDAAGYIVVSGVRTSVPGVFAAGDCARPRYKQAVIAAGDGALAALEALAFLA